MAIPSSILAWRIPMDGGYKSMGSQRVSYNRVIFTFTLSRQMDQWVPPTCQQLLLYSISQLRLQRKVPQPGGLNNRNLFLVILVSEMKAPADTVNGGHPFLGVQSFPGGERKGQRGGFGLSSSSYKKKALISSRGPILMTSYKPTYLNIFTS